MPEAPIYKITTNHYQGFKGNIDIAVMKLVTKYKFPDGIADLFRQLYDGGKCETYEKYRFFYMGYVLSKEKIQFEFDLPT